MSGHLGIDIGGTASRWVVVDEEGHAVARATAGGATGHVFNPVEREKLVGVLTKIAKVSGSVSSVVLGVTGLGTSVHGELKALAAPILGVSEAAIGTMDDMELAYRAVFAPGEGHLISAGTGSIGLHLTAGGEIVRVGGRGLLIDDGGSGTWIALRALDLLYRRIDETGGPGDAKILAEQLFEAMGGRDWDDTRAFVYGSDRGRIGTLAQVVAKAAEAGDALALQILDDAGRELARLGMALVKRAGRHPVGYIGGIVRLHPNIKTSLIAALSGEDVVFPEADAALHAARMARDLQTARQ